MIPIVFNNDLNTPRYLYRGRYSSTKVQMLTPVTATFQVNNNAAVCAIQTTMSLLTSFMTCDCQ